MATQAIDRLTELAEVGENTQVIPAQDTTEVGYQEFFAPTVLEEARVSTEVAITKPEPVHQDGFLVRLGRLLVAFNDWLSGPPMSERDPLDRAIHQEEIQWYRHM